MIQVLIIQMFNVDIENKFSLRSLRLCGKYSINLVFPFISILTALLLQGCSSVGYYFDAVNGHLSILAEQEAITDILQK
ncbi:MAG: hypothetical protein ACC653_10070, partial [Gammaproteobacteria bacterium]